MIRCPSCSKSSPDGQSFCGACGAPLGASTPVHSDSYTPAHLAREVLGSRFAREGERKLVTVVFCDIAESTSLAARVGAEAMHAILDHFFEIALAEVHRYGGTINQFLGDGFMALFGAPVAHEDHARRALLAASSISARLRADVDESTPMQQLHVRLGVHTGPVVVGAIGDQLRMDYTAVGDTTHLAARLQQFARPGSVCTSAPTRRIALAHFQFKSLGSHALKGIAESVEVFEVLDPDAPGPDGLRPRAEDKEARVFVGRDAELSALRESLQSLREGKGGIVVLQGEPGMGKSRLVAEAIRSVDATGWRRLEGRAVSFGRGLSYGPFIEILKACFGFESRDAEPEAVRKLEAGVRDLFGAAAGEIVPYLAVVLALPLTGEHERRVKFLDAQALGRQVFLSMHRLFEQLASRRPLLIVMEDWHWVDQSSVALCEHLLALTESLALAFWFVTRAEPAEPVNRIRGATRRKPVAQVLELMLVALPQTQSRLLIDAMLGRSAVPESLVGAIVGRGDGNPFFIEEVVRALIADRTLVRPQRDGKWELARPVTALALPDSIQGVIAARIDRLDDGEKSVLKLASVIGRNFFVRILHRIAEPGDRVDDSLSQLERQQLVHLRRHLPELEYIFKHALVQEAVYGSMLVERRRGIHLRVAEVIEATFADRLEEFTSLLAYHFALAQDWGRAQHYLFKAGDQAGRMSADAEALEHYRQAEAAYMNAASAQLSALQRATLDRKLGQAFYGVGSYEQAVDHLSRALAHLGVPYPRTAKAVRVSILKYVAAHFLRRLGQRAGWQPRPRMALPVAQEISTICRSLSWLDYFVDQERFGLDSLIELHAGEGSGDTLAQARGLATLSGILTLVRLPSLARRCIADALQIAAEGDDSALAPVYFFRGWLQWTTGQVDAGLESCRLAAASYQRIGDLRGWGAAITVLCWIANQRADFARSVELSNDALRVGEGAGDPHVSTWAGMTLGHAALAVGPLGEADARFSTVREICIRISSFRQQSAAAAMLAKCCLRQGNWSGAETMVREALSFVDSMKLRGTWSADAFAASAEFNLMKASSLAGAPRREALAAANKACINALGCARDAVTWTPEALRLHGTVAWLGGDAGRARQRWQESVKVADRLGLVLERARTQAEAGTRLGDATAIDAALQVFERVGARVDLAFGLHALAVQPAEAEASDVCLRRSDRAIAALRAVNAHHCLRVAYERRAHLHERSGNIDHARADMAMARSGTVPASAGL